MSTTIYLSNGTEPTPIDPTSPAAWDDTTIGGAATGKKLSQTAKRGVAGTNITFTSTAVINRNILFRRFVIPLQAGWVVTPGQTVTLQVLAMCNESHPPGTEHLCFGVQIMASDGTTIRKELLAALAAPTTLPTTYTNRRSSRTTAAGNYTTVAGDCLVLYLGINQDDGTA